MSKGSKRRPRKITTEEFNKKWDLIFKEKKCTNVTKPKT
jgi:hypothetical protein